MKNDELIKKIVDETLRTMASDFADSVWKRLTEKEQPKYPEGILSFKNALSIPQCGYQDWVHENIKIGNPIVSVKNSKGEVFTVGDEVSHCGYKIKIEKIQVDNHLGYDRLSAISGISSIAIDMLTKAEPKKEPLLTEDGFEYNIAEHHENWYLYAISKEDFSIDYPFAGDSPTEYWYFKEKHNAERYVAENRKSISYKELEHACKMTIPTEYAENLLDYFNK